MWDINLWSVFMLILGNIVGSFLNVCIVRLPNEKSVVTPRSHCIHCQKPIPWYDNIPLVSFLLLKGQCRFCKGKISWRYPFVEFVTGLTFFLLFNHFGRVGVLIPYLVMYSCFIVALFVDFAHRIIPDEVSVGGMLCGLVFSLVIPELHGIQVDPNRMLISHFHSLGMSALGVLIGGGAIYAMGILGDFLFKKESMGGGDIKLLAMIGAFLGWKLAILTFFIAPFFGAVYGIAEKIRTKDTAIAYGPFLVLGAMISMFWGDLLIAWIMSGYGVYQ